MIPCRGSICTKTTQHMKDFPINLKDVLGQAGTADVTPLRQFLTSSPGHSLLATGSGGAETVADFAALLYGARGGVATAVSPYTMNSYSDESLKTSKLLLVSKGGHNDDIDFPAFSAQGRRWMRRTFSVSCSFSARTSMRTSDSAEADASVCGGLLRGVPVELRPQLEVAPTCRLVFSFAPQIEKGGCRRARILRIVSASIFPGTTWFRRAAPGCRAAVL